MIMWRLDALLTSVSEFQLADPIETRDAAADHSSSPRELPFRFLMT